MERVEGKKMEEKARVTTVDARGLPCPQPVIMTRKALMEHDEVLTIVDNDTARENVTRLAEKAGCTIRAEQRDDGTYLHIARSFAPSQEPASAEVKMSPPSAGSLVLLVPSQFFGRGDDPVLGEILMRGFLHTLGEVQPLPDVIVFLNSGVKLTVEGSPVLEDLRALQTQGIEILACGTCLGHFGLKEKLAVGQVSNMYTIAETLLGAGRVVSL